MKLRTLVAATSILSFNIHKVSGTSQGQASSDKIYVNAYIPDSPSIPNNTPSSVSTWVKRNDSHNAFNTSTGTFTAPRSMVITHVVGSVLFNANVSGIRRILLKINSNFEYEVIWPGNSSLISNNVNASGISLKAGDTVQVLYLQDSGGALTLVTTGSCNFFTLVGE